MTNKYLTLINVFKVEAGNQQRLVELLTKATESTIIGVPGFVSAILHRSIDGTKVTMYAQWESKEAYDAMRSNPQASPFLTEALTFATFEPGMYEIVETFTAS